MNYQEIDITRIVADFTRNFRAEGRYEDDQFVALQRSIETDGLREPLQVVERDGGYWVVAGYRRFAALTNLAEKRKKKKEPFMVPVVVRSDVDETDAAFTQAVGAAQILNKPFTPMEEAACFESLQRVNGMSVMSIASATGFTVGRIESGIALCGLPEEVRNLIDSDAMRRQIGAKLAELLTKYKSLGDEVAKQLVECAVQYRERTVSDFVEAAAAIIASALSPEEPVVADPDAVEKDKKSSKENAIDEIRYAIMVLREHGSPESVMLTIPEILDDLLTFVDAGTDIAKVRWCIERISSLPLAKIPTLVATEEEPAEKPVAKPVAKPAEKPVVVEDAVGDDEEEVEEPAAKKPTSPAAKKSTKKSAPVVVEEPEDENDEDEDDDDSVDDDDFDLEFD